MKVTTFQDMNGLELQVQYSSAGDIRIYVKIKPTESCPEGSSECILLNKFQANMLINSIEDLLDEE